MSRPERIEFEGAYYHVMNRGRRREDIFHGEEYYDLFIQTMVEAIAKFNLRIHAYCLMTNHYHLLVETPDGNLQRSMRHIGGVYTQRHNRLKGCDGSLFRGRYKSILVDNDEYLLHLSKYIHRNPVEANLVDNLDEYSWSSYPDYVGKRKSKQWLLRDEVYGQLKGSRLKAKRYREYVEEWDVSDDVSSFYAKERLAPVLGNQSFIEQALSLHRGNSPPEVSHKDKIRRAPGFQEIVDVVSNVYGVKGVELLAVKKGRGVKNFPRKVAMYVCQLKGHYRLNEIAEYFGLRHYGGVSSAISAVKISRKVRKEINHIINRFDP